MTSSEVIVPRLSASGTFINYTSNVVTRTGNSTSDAQAIMSWATNVVVTAPELNTSSTAYDAPVAYDSPIAYDGSATGSRYTTVVVERL